MNTVNVLALVAHVLIAVSIIGLVLLQKGKGADAGAGFGAGASGTVFGARGSANFLSRSTAVLAALFFGSSLLLAFLNSDKQAPTSILDTVVVEEEAPAAKGVVSDEADLDLPPMPEASGDAVEEESLPVVPE